jgi:hypothetical protein
VRNSNEGEVRNSNEGEVRNAEIRWEMRE